MDERYSQAADYLKSKIPFQPEVGIILGSGLGGLADRIEDPIAVPYHEVPHMAVSTAPGHKGRFIAGRIAGVPVICMQGRLHCYEGYPMREMCIRDRLHPGPRDLRPLFARLAARRDAGELPPGPA